jgi:aminomethyltransferase
VYFCYKYTPILANKLILIKIMEENANLLTTPLIDKHRGLGAKLAPFGGWLMPIQYSGIIEEHNWTRKSCGLFDICHMGEFEIEADLGKSNLEELFTISLKAMPQGACRYGFMLDEMGRIVDDLVIYRLGQSRWMMVVNAATIPSDEAHLRRHLNSEAKVDNVSSALGKLDLQGPQSKAVLADLMGSDPVLKYYAFGYFKVLGEEIIISRTGYTGELGYELYMPNDKISALWDKLLEDKRVRPIGLGERDTLRLEMGYSLYGQDIEATTSPLEAGLGGFIDWDKDFIGKDALLRQRREGVQRSAVYFMAESRRSARHNYRIYHNGVDLGYVTSGSFSPSLGKGIGIGYVLKCLSSGEKISLNEGRITIPAQVVDKPFYKTGTARIGGN